MTEERLEQLVEGAAGRFDRSMNRAWEHRPVRLMGGALSLLTGAGLIAKAVPLAQEGRAATARVCLAAGSLVLLFLLGSEELRAVYQSGCPAGQPLGEPAVDSFGLLTALRLYLKSLWGFPRTVTLPRL